jgi:high affinity Mn2+ porin
MVDVSVTLRDPRAVLLALATLVAAAPPATAQTPPPAEPQTTMASHSDDPSWWLSGQLNLGQGHQTFPSPYAGPNSLRAIRESAISYVWTVSTGVRLSPQVEALFDVESAGGRGISDAFGLAGFTNLDVVRNPELGGRPYVARVMVHVTIPIGSETVPATAGPMSLAASVPAHRIEIRTGKFGLVDFFDVNAVGSDSHLQFTNWTIDNTGAYDYAADTRGYTYTALVEYDAPRWSLRAAEALMPTVANGIVLEWNLARARSENVELEVRPRAHLTLRLLGYENHANMGSYADALHAAEVGLTARPDITAHSFEVRRKYGVAGNVENEFRGGLRAFARAGWNDGHTESFAYTEVDDTVVIGCDLSGGRWSRSNDRLGVAVASNGLSDLHRTYLQQGGLGFLLGDGALRYGREAIVEAYYTAHVWRGLFASADGQHIANPGYNRDRGPVFIAGLRAHVDF